MENKNKEIKLKKLPIERYSEFLRILDKAYGMKEDKWFMKNLPHIYPSEDMVNMGESNDLGDVSSASGVKCGQAQKMAQWNYINEEDGEITSGLGIFPQKLRAKCAGQDIVLDLGGIGSVFAVEEYRGKGGMSSSLNDAIEIMKEDKYHLSWLSGDRYRYRNYGWDYAGSYFKLTVYMRDIERYFPDIKECNPLTPTVEHIPSLKKMYSKFESGIVRDDEMWKTHLSRKNLKWSYLEENGKEAYFVQYGKNTDFIPEIQGDVDCAVKLLMNHMKKENLEKVTILAPYGDSPINKLLKYISGDIIINNCGSIKITDYDGVWEMMKEKLVVNIEGIECEEIKDKLKYMDKKTDKNIRNAFIRKIFGFWYDDIELTEELKQLADRLKVNWWMSTLDMV
ncbi:GNAT family N-acetyltransferase [Oceanirhabdus seepicola]|uniref:GNAT family N-acetyltransferase n=1 Tax=Oceanirhabdus seepicola TaxID=2828781 RepID=A0A9J6NYL9_9CLOT|nr:GNAT family N-acetyltransferase [Oceanirhabdus seepicola]MCM1989363.1 GNAT family N-acetyltransferase [Oceanirhabdus seepicola]